MIREIIEKLFWNYQEKDNWAMKMNEPITIKKLTKEEAQIFFNETKTRKNEEKRRKRIYGYVLCN